MHIQLLPPPLPPTTTHTTGGVGGTRALLYRPITMGWGEGGGCLGMLTHIYTHLFEFADIYKLCVYTYSYTLYRSDRKILSSCLEAFFGQQNVPLGCSNLWKNAVLLPWHLPQVQLLFVSSVEDSGRTV